MSLIDDAPGGNSEPDPDLRDFENVPLEDDIDAYFERDVRPHLPEILRLLREVTA